MMKRFVAWVLLFASVWYSAAVLAQDDPAKQQFLKAQEFFDNGEYSLALPLFEEAHRTSQSPNARLYVARTLREMGRLIESHDQFQLTFDEAAGLSKTDDKYAPTRDAAAAELARLHERLARVAIAFAEPYPEATVTVGDRKLTPEEVGRPLALAPGEVVVHVEMAGRHSFDKTLQLEAGQYETVAVTLGKVDEPAPVVAPVVRDDPGLGTVRIVGIAVAGVGVVGLVVMGVTGAMAQGKKDQLSDECGGQRCTDPGAADVIDEGKSLRLISNVMLGVGAACSVAGAAMIIWGGPSDDERAAWIAPAPVYGGAGLTMGGRF
jgi:hypothetical protein